MVFKGKYIYFPDGTKYIISSTKLKKIVIPSSVTSIGSSAFSGCSSLQSITIPSSVTSIGNNAFYRCSSLKSITIPESVTSIGDDACSGLHNCYIYKINSSAKIGRYTYKSGGSYMQISYDFSECSAIPVLSSSSGIANIDEIYMIIVPDALYDEWIAATNWVAYASKIKKVSEVGNTEVAG